MTTAKTFSVISPIDGSVYLERPYASSTDIDKTFAQANTAFSHWRETPLAKRIEICTALVDYFQANQDSIAKSITWQMGRPIAYSAGEARGTADRAKVMTEIAARKLQNVDVPAQEGFKRYMQRVPLGVVFSMTPWNYPFLTAVNVVVPAILAGNVVVMKASAQTPQTAEIFADAFNAAKLPQHVFQFLHLDHAATESILKKAPINYVGFTGSVSGGAAVERALAGRFIGLGLELGGKDPAYVRADAPVEQTVVNLVDGAFFNSGQSCCGIERIYVQRAIFKDFVDAFVAEVNKYKLDDPSKPDTTLGPMVRASAAEHVRKQIDDALAKGAKALIDEKHFPKSGKGTPYLAPQVLIDVDHSMDVMREESFGPVIGIMPVDNDEQAVELMNDSHYGLTASIWTQDMDVAERLGQQLETGTVFMNRCDYLDPYLCWNGVKDTGRGGTLSEIGFEHLTRPKSFHLKR
ncbi:MAG: aldehyde dehydrogenase family protein [Gammaproteobacteria bacterium]|nr:aldehyde dehydrogenase family protein [Gammaproteobacteria bacterium]